MKAALRLSFVALFAMLCGIATPTAEAQDNNPAISELRIAIQDMATKEQRGYVNPGEVLTLEVGERVRLRMVAIPAGAHRAPRYPSTRFGELAGVNRVNLSKVDPREGSAILEAVSTEHRPNPGATTLIEYELLEPVNIRKGMLKGTITVEVIESRNARPVDPPVTRPDRPGRDGVTLYEHQRFGGRSETFYEDDPRLNDNQIRQDTASSVRVPQGCRVFLFEHPNYEGKSTVLEADIYDLTGTRVGNDSVSSLRIECDGRQRGYYRDDRNNRGNRGDRGYRGDRGARAGSAVTLYEHQNYTGRSEVFFNSDAQLADNSIRQDTASSVRVDPGCEVLLFEHADYRGRSTVLTASIADLTGTRVGNDSVSSLDVRCQ
ncbi:MAG: beta/gamma crystallin-related protein [Acidobacteriota bacterium]|nr:beta/gamma crystallin-related protein [Acidobacteriota bacterium]